MKAEFPRVIRIKFLGDLGRQRYVAADDFFKIFDSGHNVSGIFMSQENRQHLVGTVEMLGVKCFCLPFYMLSIVTAGLWYLIFLTIFLFTRITCSYLFCHPFLLGHSSWFGHVIHESRFSCRG